MNDISGYWKQVMTSDITTFIISGHCLHLNKVGLENKVVVFSGREMYNCTCIIFFLIPKICMIFILSVNLYASWMLTSYIHFTLFLYLAWSLHDAYFLVFLSWFWCEILCRPLPGTTPSGRYQRLIIPSRLIPGAAADKRRWIHG